MYKFCPILKTLVWGTENWVLSSVPGSESVVSEGPEAGRTLTEVYGGRFPLLVKFIDARKDLSIQVHPDDCLAARRHGCSGKTEMWYIIGADEGAHLISGMSREITPEEYVELVAQDRIVDALCDHKVAPGDVFFLPAGRIHAIGGGCFLAEIQQTSDITYRIYDYNRPGLDGRPRQLHTELAREAIDYSVSDNYRSDYNLVKDEETVIVSCRHFTTSLFDITRPCTFRTPGYVPDGMSGDGKWCAVVCLEGSGTVNGVGIRAGESLLLTPEEPSFALAPDSGPFKLLTGYV